jgi:hypothetical protein
LLCRCPERWAREGSINLSTAKRERKEGLYLFPIVVRVILNKKDPAFPFH